MAGLAEAHGGRVPDDLTPPSASVGGVLVEDCPCGSGEEYAACCGPLHWGAAAAPTAEALIYGLIQLQNKIRRTNTIAR